jgi:EAL domain-containing protein (putative c-di-GMP-specific phosphodiesterase class I)
LSVNLTQKQFLDDHLASDVSAILAETGFDPALLELEISETTLMANVDRTLRILEALRACGVRVALDDFGSGYTTLASLEQFPLATLKIDRSFIRQLVQATEGESLADAVIAMGKALSVTVVAQGVETREQLEYLREHECDEVQGFYFNAPLSGDELPAVWHRHDVEWPPVVKAGRPTRPERSPKPS